MKELLEIPLRFAGGGLLALALLHIPIARRLRWVEEAARMSELNAAVFHAHTFFLCVGLVGMGLPALIEPAVFLEPSRAARWGCGFLTLFWALRLLAQWCHYRPSWWRGLRFETAMHWVFTLLWIFLTALFGTCFALQATAPSPSAATPEQLSGSFSEPRRTLLRHVPASFPAALWQTRCRLVLSPPSRPFHGFEPRQ